MVRGNLTIEIGARVRLGGARGLGAADGRKTFAAAELDVMRHLKRLAAGATTFNGFALKGIPDRGVDHGCTVRVDITRDKPTYVAMDLHDRLRGRDLTSPGAGPTRPVSDGE